VACFAVIELLLPMLFVAASFSAGASLAAGVAALDGAVWLQWTAFLVASFGLLLILVPIGRRIAASRPGDEAVEGAERWVGRIAVVLEDIPPGPHATGLVRLERREWKAESDGPGTIPLGTDVDVLAVRGTRLVVAPHRLAKESS
jgi:membrane protein implicated in regulation of membrane protease activity